MATIQSMIVYTMLQLYKGRQYFSGYSLYGLGPESIFSSMHRRKSLGIISGRD